MIADEKAFGRMLYLSTQIPVTCYCPETGQTASFPSTLSDETIFKITPDGFAPVSKNPDYVILKSFSYYGFVTSQATGNVFLIGPVFSTPVTTDTVHSFMTEWGIALNHYEDIEFLLKNVPLLSLNHFVETLAFAMYCLNDVQIDVSRHFSLISEEVPLSIHQKNAEQLQERKEEQKFHNTRHFEQEMFSYIREGEPEQLSALLQTASHLNAGVLALDAVRQEKNLFITTVALASRAAMEGGLDVEQSYLLADLYLQECEKLNQVQEISALNYTMLMDFCRRVQESKMPTGLSKEVFDAIQYIMTHTNAPIRVTDVAEHVYRSRSWLAQRFKEELGRDISECIMSSKLTEAKRLLTFSQQSLAEISSYLYFSSQSYFQSVFKKKYGVTPAQYRRQSQQTEEK